MAQDTIPARSDALARATALANRARELRRAQAEVQDLTLREVKVLARTAASFFDTIRLPEFTSTLLPQSARGLRRIRHRVLHRTILNTETGTLIRALLLGRDGVLRLFSARSAESRDLLLILEPGRSLPVGVMREVVDWTPTLRVPGFRPFEILDRLSHSLDAVEDQISDAEERVQVQKAALASGDLSALLAAPSVTPAERGQTVDVFTHPARITDLVAVRSATVPPETLSPIAPHAADPFAVFDLVEAVANAAPMVSVLPAIEVSVEPDEWDDPIEDPAPRRAGQNGKSATGSPRLR
jgi:hypothetical protein